MRRLWSLVTFVAVIVVYAPAAAQTIDVTTSGDDVVLTCPTVFQLRFDRSQGGNITQYFDLVADPGATINLAAASGSLYDGLFFVMFKQESPEVWTANFRTAAESIEVIDALPQQVKVRVRGTFPDGGFGLPASWEFFYTITADAQIHIRSRITFNRAYSNEMQIRQALGLTSRYATPTGWVEFSQDRDLAPFYYHGGGDDDYLGARINASGAQVDPVLILHEDWDMADYILIIAPDRAEERLIAWTSNRHHSFSAGQVIENRYLLLMSQRDITSHGAPASLAAAYRAGEGGDFGDQPGAPLAMADADPTSGIAPLAVSFDGSGSQDLDGTIESYLWDFGDGSTNMGVTGAHTYSRPDTYLVTLTVTDDSGNEDSASLEIVVEGLRVVVDNSDPAPAFTSQGQWPTFDLRPGYYGSDYAINDGGVGADWARWQPDLPRAGPYRVYASWSTDADRPTDAPFTIHHSQGQQTFLVSMRVTDASGWNVLGELDFDASGGEYVELSDNISTGAEVIADAVMFEYLGANEAPSALISASPRSGFVPLEVSFDGTESTDTDGRIVAYSWDFGDGDASTSQAVDHVYTVAGRYEVTLSVTDDDGTQGTDTVSIEAMMQSEEDGGGPGPSDGGSADGDVSEPASADADNPGSDVGSSPLLTSGCTCSSIGPSPGGGFPWVWLRQLFGSK